MNWYRQSLGIAVQGERFGSTLGAELERPSCRRSPCDLCMSSLEGSLADRHARSRRPLRSPSVLRDDRRPDRGLAAQRRGPRVGRRPDSHRARRLPRDGREGPDRDGRRRLPLRSLLRAGRGQREVATGRRRGRADRARRPGSPTSQSAPIGCWRREDRDMRGSTRRCSWGKADSSLRAPAGWGSSTGFIGWCEPARASHEHGPRTRGLAPLKDDLTALTFFDEPSIIGHEDHRTPRA